MQRNALTITREHDIIKIPRGRKAGETGMIFEKDFYTRDEVKEIFGVNISTVSRWISAGRIQVIRAVKNGKCLIPRSELEKLLSNTEPAPVSDKKVGRKKAGETE